MEGYKTILVELTLFIGLALLWPVDVTAIDDKGKYGVLGIGAKKGGCGEYVRAKDAEVRRWYESWLTGYISGFNHGKPGKTDYSNGVDANGLVQWIENYCKQNPSSPFGDAINEMLEDIGKKK